MKMKTNIIFKKLKSFINDLHTLAARNTTPFFLFSRTLYEYE